MKSLTVKKAFKKCILVVLVVTATLSVLNGQSQQKLYIKGQLKDQQNLQAVAYATVAIRRVADSTLITGTASNADGEFSIESVPGGSYCIIISAIGYNLVRKNIDLNSDYNTGTILLQEKSVNLGEIVVVGERMKAKAEADKTTYFMNRKMYDASNTGVDMLNYIPGVQVDLMKNISLEGSQQIIILVDGKERDRNFLSQLNASQIDKVEVNNTPGSRYDSGITGVINIILKKDKEPGISGHIHAEVPTSKSEIYISPDYSFNFSFKKLNLYTSYDGNLSYFNITESSNRNFQDNLGITEITSNQFVRQKYWSHRFHYGIDYIFNEKNQVNFYAYYNPYSSEHDGNVELQVTGDKIGDRFWSALKNDTDINHSSFYSLYYKHVFDKPGREIAFDLSYSDFKAENSTSYTTTYSIPDNYLTNRINIVKPRQNSGNIRIDYSSPITEKLKFDAGIKVKLQLLQDQQSDAFKYNESIFALYGAVTYNFSKYTLSAGLRAEESVSGLTNGFNNRVLALLPNAAINYKLTPKQSIKFSYSRTVNRPNIYDLNPYTSAEDPFTIQSGNPGLKQEFRQNITIDYSKSIGNNYISFQLFYKKRADAINHYMFINESDIFENRVDNLGNIHEYGIQMTAALKLHKAIDINPYFKLFSINTIGNSLAEQYNIVNRKRVAFESGLSAIVTFKYDIVASLQFQYNSPRVDIQSTTFSDALCFISLEKAFKHKIKVGIKSALPFSRSFTYQGSETTGNNFYSHSEGNVKLSGFPVWLTFKYQFNSGKILNRIDHTKEDIVNMPRKGF
jgi:hypothetical protein